MNKLQWKQWYREQRIAKKEIWKEIKGFEGIYKVSDLGNVIRLKDGLKIGGLHRSGYVRVRLSKNGRVTPIFIHRLVAQAFIPNPKNKPQVNHKNGIRADNRACNLEWCTSSENMKHQHKFLNPKLPGLGKFGILNSNSKRVYQYSLFGEFIREWSSMAEIEREIGLKVYNVSKCCIGSTKSCGGLIFSFEKKDTVFYKRKRYKNQRNILQYHMNMTFIKEWSSIAEASKALGIKGGNIGGACIEKYGVKSAGGFKWRFK